MVVIVQESNLIIDVGENVTLWLIFSHAAIALQ
jgi:hypothetical protein